jgi:tripartite-type tricarboxylate transporter receptor subunit TctC
MPAFKVVAIAILFFCALGSTGLTHAQGNYPSKPVKTVVPFPAGGVADMLARVVSHKLSSIMDEQFIVENRPGAGTNIGSELVAKSPADGYTLLMASSSNVVNVSLYRKLAYDPIKDFAPISVVANVPMMLVVHPSVPAKSVQDFIALAKREPIPFASAGNGSPAHMAAELFKYLTKVQLLHVPYKGAPPAVIDLVGGRVPVMFTNLSVTLPHIQAGRLRALGYGGPKRTSALPDLPTIAEAGVPGYDSTVWWGLVAPAGTPKGIVERLSKEVNKILQMGTFEKSS